MSKQHLVRREHYQGILDKNTALLKKGAAKNIALLGARKSGKTQIVKEHLKNAKDVVPVYIDLRKTSLNPENFSIEFIGNIIFHFLERPLKDYNEYMSLEGLLKIKNEISQAAFFHIKAIQDELLKIKPDQNLLVRSAFAFSEHWAREVNKKFLIVLDNIENLFELNNFSQIKDILELVNLESKDVSYIATSSTIKESALKLKKFERFEIKNLEKKEALELIEKTIGSKDSSEEIFNLSNGHPLVTLIISKKFIETKDARRAFFIELLQKNNPLYHHCEDSFNYYYNRARGQTLLKSILKIVANEELRLSEIARKVYRSAPVAKSILERLMDVDVIHKKDSKFYFSDPVLKLWVKLASKGYEFDEIDEKLLEEAMKQ